MKCILCPVRCEIDRNLKTGYCGAAMFPKVASVMPHYWEEPCISGKNGSGAIFFSGCNLKCIFCQNYLLNDGSYGKEVDAKELSNLMMSLQEKGVHNINLVTPTPHLGTIIPAIRLAKKSGLKIPIVYNTNSYETVSAIRALSGLIDIYLPDFKYESDRLSVHFSSAPNYKNVALKAIGEMLRQVGNLSFDHSGMAEKGVLIRHLVLPNCLDDSRRILDLISENYGNTVYLSLMRQYAPTKNVHEFPLNRKLTSREYKRITDYCIGLGFQNVFIQESSSASLEYTPDFTNSTLISEGSDND